jgi:hypothetical protein
MGEDPRNGNKDQRLAHDRRSGRERRSEPRYEQRDVAEFLRGQKVRFVHPSPIVDVEPGAADDAAAPDHRPGKKGGDRRSGNERRAGKDRRCGFDRRSEVESFLQGERRSGLDRRSKGGYRTFKKARVFAHDLKLKSVRDWQIYVAAGTKPEDIPDAPEIIYANDGWAGWGDWLGTTAAATYFKQRN